MSRKFSTYDITSLSPIEWVEVPYFANGVQTALQEGRAERVLELLQIAARGSAADLMNELYHQALIGNISYSSIPTTLLREIINDFFKVNFGYENIRKYRRDVVG